MARKSVKDINSQLARIRELYQGDRSVPNLARLFRAEDLAERYRNNLETASQAKSKG